MRACTPTARQLTHAASCEKPCGCFLTISGLHCLAFDYRDLIALRTFDSSCLCDNRVSEHRESNACREILHMPSPEGSPYLDLMLSESHVVDERRWPPGRTDSSSATTWIRAQSTADALLFPAHIATTSPEFASQWNTLPAASRQLTR